MATLPQNTTVVAIPKVGTVAFPPEMDEAAITKASKELHDKALVGGVMQFVAQDPALTQLPASEFHKQMGSIATLLEKFPRLAQAVDAGMSKTTSPAPAPAAAPAAEPEQAAPQSQEPGQ
jgi:hypothetical protein